MKERKRDGLLGRDTTSMPKIGISNPALGIAIT